MTSDAKIEAYAKNNALLDEIFLSEDEITESLGMMKAEKTPEQLTYLTRNTAEPP